MLPHKMVVRTLHGHRQRTGWHKLSLAKKLTVGNVYVRADLQAMRIFRSRRHNRVLQAPVLDQVPEAPRLDLEPAQQEGLLAYG